MTDNQVGATSTTSEGSATISRRFIIALVAIGAVAIVLRCLHLLVTGHYYLISADSYFFHWLAGRIATGQAPPLDAPPEAIYTLHSGLAYPVAYVAKSVTSVFGFPADRALDLSCVFIPPLLGLLTLAIVYLAAAKICNRNVALFAALSWAFMGYAVFLGAAGMVDRDGLNVFLLTLGAIAFYLSEGYHVCVRGKDFGWLLAGVAVLGIEALLYLEWSIVGSLVMLTLLAVYFVLRFLLEFAQRMKTEPTVGRRLAAALKEARGRTFAVVVVGNAIIALALHSEVSYWVPALGQLLAYRGTIQVVELMPSNVWDLLAYGFFLIPMAVGLGLSIRSALKGQSNGMVFFACWLLLFLILSVLARRFLTFATPAACFLSGVGLAFLWGWAKEGGLSALKKVGVGVLLLLIMFTSFSTSTGLGSQTAVAIDSEWYDALQYLRQDTPQDAVVMSRWSYGYWILDVGKREPVVDNGYYGYDANRLRDVGLAYFTSDPSSAAQIMEKYGADYLVFSKADLEAPVPILESAGLSGEYDRFPEDSLVSRSLSGSFESGGGLEVVYRSAPNSEVVILALTGSQQP